MRRSFQKWHKISASLPVMVALLLGAPLGCARVGDGAGAMVQPPADALAWAQPRLIEDLRGLWFIVLPERAGDAEIGSPWVVLEVRGERKLFFALRRGRRVAELVPISPASGAWWDRARLAPVRASWPKRLDASLKLSDPIATIGAASGGAGGLVWLGAPPRGAWTGAVLSERWGEDGEGDGQGGNPLAALAGEASGTDSALSSVTPRGLSGLVLAEVARVASAPAPEAKAAQGVPPISVALFTRREDDEALRKALGQVEGISVKVHPARELFAWRAEVPRPWALEVGADVAMVSDAGGWGGAVVLGITPAEAAASATHTAPALGHTLLHTTTLHHGARAASGLAALQRGQALVAAYRLGGVRLKARSAAYRWRIAELAGAASRAQWLAREVALRRPYPDAPGLVTLARASLLEDSPRQAARLAREAEAAFGTWQGMPARHGAARAAATLATALAATDDPRALPEAIAAATRAEAHLKAAPDELRRARVELLLATLHTRRHDRDNALLYARLARSRAYHGGDALLCAQAELHLAHLLATSPAERPLAIEMARNAERRLATLGWPAGTTLAQITRLTTSPTEDPDPQKRVDPNTLRAALDAHRLTARTLNAPTVEAAAAAAWTLADTIEPPEAVLTQGDAMIRGWSASAHTAHMPQLTRALTILCPQGLASTTPRAAEVCATATRRVPRDATTHHALLTRGHRLLDALASPGSEHRSCDKRCSQDRQRAAALAATLTTLTSPKTRPHAEAALLATRAAHSDTHPSMSPQTRRAADAWLATVNPAAPPTVELSRADLATRRGRPALATHLIRGALARHAAHQPDALISRRELSWALLDHLITHRAPADTITAALTAARPLMRPTPGTTEPPVDDLLWHLHDATLRDDTAALTTLTTRAAALPDLHQLAFWVRAAALHAAIARAHDLHDLTRRDHARVARLRDATDTIERLITGLSPHAYMLPAHRLTLHRALWWRAFALITDGKPAQATPLLKELITRATDHPPSALVRERAVRLLPAPIPPAPLPQETWGKGE